jgi:hypothetical protein
MKKQTKEGLVYIAFSIFFVFMQYSAIYELGLNTGLLISVPFLIMLVSGAVDHGRKNPVDHG